MVVIHLTTRYTNHRNIDGGCKLQTIMKTVPMKTSGVYEHIGNGKRDILCELVQIGCEYALIIRDGELKGHAALGGDILSRLDMQEELSKNWLFHPNCKVNLHT